MLWILIPLALFLGIILGVILGIIFSYLRLKFAGSINVVTNENGETELYLAANQERLNEITEKDYAVFVVKRMTDKK